MIKTLKFSLIAFLLLVVGYLYASPYLTLYQIKTAIESGDVNKISNYIDYPKVRQNLKAQMKTKLEKKLGVENSPFASKLTDKLTDEIIDTAVSPKGITLFIKGQALGEKLSANTSPSSDLKTDDNVNAVNNKYQYGYKSFNEFGLSVANEDSAKAPIEVRLSRDGLSWKISDIKLPDFDK